MRQSLFLLPVLLLSFTLQVDAQFLKEAKSMVQKAKGGVTFSEGDAASAIKEALNKGIAKGVEMVSKENGYFGDIEIKIPFPQEAKSMEDKLRAIGMGNKVDEVVLSINRAAEDAAIKAKDIFMVAIKQMTLTDAINIVKGEDNAATKYLQTHTTDELVRQFSPVIAESLTKVNATKYWSDVIGTYNKIPLVRKMNPDLTDYVTHKAIDGLFVKIAKEEKDIRKNPAARTSELLKKVFGN
jgi:hypothetical protein